MKKTLVALLIVFMVSIPNVFAYASEADDSQPPVYEVIYVDGNYHYALEEHNGEMCAIITKYTWTFAYDLEIPPSLGGYPVYRIESEAFKDINLIEVTLPEGIKNIGKDAFKNCEAYRINIPNTVEEIHEEAFGVRGEEGCTLDTTTLITDFGSYTYNYALQNSMKYTLNSYTEIVAEEAIVRVEDPILIEEGTSLQVNVINDGEEFETLTKELQEAAVMYELCFVKDGAIVSPEGAMRVYLDWPDNLNSKYGTLYRVEDDNTLTELTQYTLETYSWSEYFDYAVDWFGETKVGKYLLVNGHVNGNISNDFVIEDGVLKEYLCCDRRVVIPEGVTEIADNAFHMSSVKEVVLPESLKKIGRGAFMYSGLETINVAEDVEMGDCAFQFCYNLVDENGFVIVNGVLYDISLVPYSKQGTMTIPEGVTTISSGLYDEVWELEKIILPDSLRVIRPSAFSGCSSLKELVLPERLEYIGKYAFSGTSLTSITIPDSVTTIEENALKSIRYRNEDEFTVYAKSLSQAEVEATKQNHIFIPTNDQLRGDVDGNRKLEAEDALGILKMVVKLETKYGYSADANEDGEVAAEDALKVLRKVVGLE